MDKLCGEGLSSLVGGDSPFAQIVFMRYYDGAISGALRCASGTSVAYRFDVLAIDHSGEYDHQAWDRGEEIRIFSLATLPISAYERFESILSQDDARTRIAEDEDYFNAVYSILDAAGPPELVIATHGIATGIIAARQVSSREISSVQDWFSFLGLAHDR
jgi:hypothetical protein